MRKVSVLSILALGLLASNLGLLGYLFFRTPPGGRGEGPKKAIIEKLHLDAAQIEAYEELIHWHRREVNRTDDQIYAAKNALYKTLVAPENQSQRDSLILVIGKWQREAEQIHYKHFEDIKRLCKPEQMVYYQQFASEITQLFHFKKPRDKR